MTKTTTSRENARDAFLTKAGWADADAAPLTADASTRRYERLTRGGETALLMIAPPGAEAPACPPDADAQTRKALGYNALARLAGPNLNAFTAMAGALRAAGLSAPAVYAADAKAGLALIEDLGDGLFARVAGHEDETALYRAAVDALVALRIAAPTRPESAAYAMLDYDAAALAAETALLADWYWPLKTGSAMPGDLQAELAELWAPLLGALSDPHSFVLRDYHAENLLWLPRREGVKRVGVIDFQDALYGAAAYDLVSLLEDARRDVAPDLADAMQRHYAERAHAAGGFDQTAFKRDYAVLAAQRNAKILGIFARLAERDGKRRYIDLLPRVENHFRRDLGREGLEDLAQFFKTHLPELAP